MRRYLVSSTVAHVTLIAFFMVWSWYQRISAPFFIDGFDYLGSGGGGDGREGSGGIKKEQMGQVVPAPQKVAIPSKPAPVQKQTAGEETWKVKDAQKIKPEKIQKAVEEPVERGEKPQEEKTNVIRRGVSPNAVPGEGTFDFGAGGPGQSGEGKGPGIGIGVGPGEGGFGGFGSYLKILRQRIWAEWTQSAVYGGNQVCIVGLTIGKSGFVSDVRVEKASGNSFYDTVALRAVRNASPLPPLPPNFPKDEQRFRIQFRLLE